MEVAANPDFLLTPERVEAWEAAQVCQNTSGPLPLVRA